MTRCDDFIIQISNMSGFRFQFRILFPSRCALDDDGFFFAVGGRQLAQFGQLIWIRRFRFLRLFTVTVRTVRRFMQAARSRHLQLLMARNGMETGLLRWMGPCAQQMD